MTQVEDELEFLYNKIIDEIDATLVSSKVADLQKAIMQQLVDFSSLHLNDIPLKYPYP